MTFKEVPNKVDFVAQEYATLKFWEESKALGKLRALRNGAPKWSFIDGPITANNPMGVHHGWGRTYKDLYNRYYAMQGHELRYQQGFDCQGLWVEVEVEKELKFTSKRDIEAYGLDKFVLRCKERVLRYAAEQIVGRLGLPELGGSYFTFSDENNYMIWAFLKKCWQKGWLYRGADSMPWCPRCATGISQHEIESDGYKDVTHRSVTVRFPLHGRPNESLLVWTTTPWTLTSNVVAAVGPELTYAKVQQGEQIYYLSKGTLHMLKGEHKVLGELKGSEMEGWAYDGPFDDLPAEQQPGGQLASKHTHLANLIQGIDQSAAQV